MEMPSNGVTITTTIRISGDPSVMGVDTNEFTTSLFVQDNRLDRITALTETAWRATDRACWQAIRRKQAEREPLGKYTKDEGAGE